MKGYILVSTMALIMILSAALINSAHEGASALKRSLLWRDRFQLEALTDVALRLTQDIIVQLPLGLTPTPITHCSVSPCVIALQESHFFLEQPLAWWFAENNPVPIRVQLPGSHQARLVLEQLAMQYHPETRHIQEHFRGTLILYHHSQALLRLQVYFVRETPETLNYQHTPVGLATLKGEISKVRRLALRRA